MTLTYEPGGSIAHGLDPRSKLAVQVAFAAAALVYTTPRGLAVLTGLVAGLLAAARTSPLWALHELRFALPFVVLAPLLEGLTLGAPWFVVGDAVAPALASYRIVLVLLVTAAFVRTTPVRDSRAAFQRLVPGRAGQFLGMGASFVFRFLPVLQADIARIREAHRSRLGERRPLRERIRLLVVAAFNRAFRRADTFALALQARCFAWNPTLPALRFSRGDVVALALAAALAVAGVAGRV
jgi:biotin transport system permease protein